MRRLQDRIPIALLCVFFTVPGTLLARQQQDWGTLQNLASLAPPEGDQEPQKTVPAPVVEQPKQVVTPAETRKTISTGRKIFTDLKGDQEDIWTSPFHIQRQDVKWWAGFGLTTAALIATDRTTERWISFSPSQTKISKDISQVGEEYVAFPIAGALYLYGRSFHNPKAREVGVLGAEALIDSEIVVNVLKLASGRERPNVVGGNGRFFKGQGFNSGFPSGHAIETWTFASIIGHEYSPSLFAPILAYGLATTVSVARYTGQFHYPSDIVAGGAMGWFIGAYVWHHHLDPTIHKRYGISRVFPKSIAPLVRPENRAVGLSLRWTK